MAWLSGNSEPVWGYHATDITNLASIKRKGLVPYVNLGLVEEMEARGEDPETVPPMVYFDAEKEWVEDYGDVVLRFPMPDDAEDAEDKWGTAGMVTYKKVPPSKIEIYDAETDDWKPLIKRRK